MSEQKYSWDQKVSSAKSQNMKLMHKSQLFSSMNPSNKQLELEINKTIPFTIACSNMKYLGSNLTKYVQDPYTKNYETVILKMKN